MRLAFCFMSNNYRRAVAMESCFNYSMAAAPYVVDAFTQNILTNPPMRPQDLLGHWNVRWKRYESFLYTDFFSMRQDSLDMAGHADVIYVGDDDFLFDGASQAINECCLYMQEFPDCGVILLGDNWGEEGKKHGEEIYITNNGHLNTNRGIVLRNRKSPLMDSRFHAVGAMEDTIISFTALMEGYFIARRLHVPIKHMVERNTLSSLNKNIDYDLDFIKSRGIWSKVTKLIGPWPDQNIWPKDIWQYYRQRAMVRGFTPRYDPDGEIL